MNAERVPTEALAKVGRAQMLRRIPPHPSGATGYARWATPIRRRIATLTLIWSALSAPAAATPIEQVKETMDQVLAIVRENPDESDKTGRRELLRAVLASRFDFREMAKRSLGQQWSRLAERQQEFVSVFRTFVENSYVSKLESLKQTRVVYLREHVESNLARIDTKIVPDRGDEVPIHYRLHLVGSEWKIYDVVVENISLVENLRSQFRRVLANATFDDLLKKLQQKTSVRGG